MLKQACLYGRSKAKLLFLKGEPFHSPLIHGSTGPGDSPQLSGRTAMPKRTLRQENQTRTKRPRIAADPQAPGELCKRCSEVAATSTNPRTLVDAQRGIQLAPVNESVDRLRSSTCEFCQLIACIKQPQLDTTECCLYAFSANSVYAHARKQVLQKSMVADSLVLGILRATGKRPKAQPDDFIGLIDHTRPPFQLFIGAQKIEPRQIDYERLKTWIDFCQDKHKGLCLSPNAKPPPKFRVIDITTRRVVQAPKECNYVALSYVWGNPAVSTNSGFSCVVEDSMIVCKALGYRYLWVDQYVSPFLSFTVTTALFGAAAPASKSDHGPHHHSATTKAIPTYWKNKLMLWMLSTATPT
jgi:hypothetical protein